MKTLLFMAAVVGFVALWLYMGADSWLFWLGWPIGAWLIFWFWRDLTAVKEPPEGLAALSQRLGVPLRSGWGMGLDLRDPRSRGATLQRRAEGEYKGLRLHYADNSRSSRIALQHAAPLNLGLFCDFNAGVLSELRQGRPILARKLTVPTPGLTCYAVAREPAGRLFQDSHVREGLARLQAVVAKLDAGAFLLDDRAVTLVSRTVDIDEPVLGAMHDLSTAIHESGLLPAHPPAAATATSRRVFAVIVGLVMLAVLAMMLFGPR